MRKISAFLAILIALSGALGFVAGPSLEAIITSGVFAVALVAAAVIALRGGDLIYLAASWGLYLGMNLVAYVEVVDSLRDFARGAARLFLSILLAAGVAGLSLTLIARRQEHSV